MCQDYVVHFSGEFYAAQMLKSMLQNILNNKNTLNSLLIIERMSVNKFVIIIFSFFSYRQVLKILNGLSSRVLMHNVSKLDLYN